MPRAAPCSAGWRCCCGAPSGRSPTAGRVTRSPGCSTTPCCRRLPSSNGASRRPTPSWRVPPAQADQDLRAFLFGGAGSAGDDLRGRIHAAVEQARQRAAVPAIAAPRISVSVIDDGCRLGRAPAGPARAGDRRGGRQRPRARPRGDDRRVRRDRRRRAGVRHRAGRRDRIRPGRASPATVSPSRSAGDWRRSVDAPRCTATPDGGTEVRLWTRTSGQ